VADRELSLPGARLHYRDSGCGPALVLLHGWTLDLQMWAPQVRALQGAFRLIRYDRRGFGRSGGQPSPEHDIRDLTALCDHLRLRSFALLGMSQGARVAAQAAARLPSRVSCVIFDGPPRGLLRSAEPGHPVSTAKPEQPDQDVPIAAYRALVRTHGVNAFRNHWRQHPLVRLRTRHEPTRRLVREMLERYPAADLLTDDLQGTHASSETPRAPVPEPVGSITAPALVITGAFDLESRIRAADELARSLSRCERASVPDAGHLANLDNPPYYNALLRRFLSEAALETLQGHPAQYGPV